MKLVLSSIALLMTSGSSSMELLFGPSFIMLTFLDSVLRSCYHPHRPSHLDKNQHQRRRAQLLFNEAFCTKLEVLKWHSDVITRWWFQIFFIFTPNPGEMIQFDEHIFQMGWFNHQLDYIQQNSPKSQDQSLQFSKVQALRLLLSMELARDRVNPDIVSYSSVISAAEKGAV